MSRDLSEKRSFRRFEVRGAIFVNLINVQARSVVGKERSNGCREQRAKKKLAMVCVAVAADQESGCH